MMLNEVDVTGYETLFLDRDGVINRLRPNDYVKCWSEFEFLPGVLDALERWNNQMKHIIIVTNQRGVGKGLMTEDDLKEVHRKMSEEIVLHNGRLDKIYYCTALTDADPNRKPSIGMFLQAVKDFPDIKKESSMMIGNSESDMQFAENCGIKGFKIL